MTTYKNFIEFEKEKGRNHMAVHMFLDSLRENFSLVAEKIKEDGEMNVELIVNGIELNFDNFTNHLEDHLEKYKQNLLRKAYEKLCTDIIAGEETISKYTVKLTKEVWWRRVFKRGVK
jgi:hypothetical protein